MKLNKEQQTAVDHLQGPLLVLAGAGSGKTRVVTHRVAKLIENGILAKDILCVTFTNKAALEMAQRIKAMTNANILACTFHSLSARILRQSISEIGYLNDFLIYDNEDSQNLIRKCLEKFDFKKEKSTVKTIKVKISNAKNELISPEDIPFSKEDELFCKIYPLYQKKLKEANALDFDDLLFLCVKLLQDKPDVRKYFQNRWLFLLIDEYQDTNLAQYTLSKILSQQHQNIFVVGDPDQSIYSWRGAKYQNILNFDSDFENSQTIKLEHNYRSTNTILSASNALIEKNPNRYKKNLWSTLGEGEKINLFSAYNEQEEADFITDKISQYLVKGKKARDIVIFYRTNAQSRAFEEALIARQIPYVIYGGLSFYQRREIKDVLAFLKIVSSGYDLVSFSRTINIPKRGIGKKTIEKLENIAEDNLISIFDVCSKITADKSFLKNISISTKAVESIKEYVQIIQHLRSLVIDKIKLHEVLKVLVEKIGYFSYLKQDPQSFEDRKENIDSLIAKASFWEEKVENPTLINFLEELALVTNTDDDQNTQKITLMTIHNGKGLEFDSVFIAGLEEDIFPHINSKNNQAQIEEERRLFYVAMTRAKKNLYISFCAKRFIWGSKRDMRKSRFLKDIPSQYLKTLSPFSQEITYVEEETDTITEDFCIGNKVIHKIFGTGVIKKAYKTSLGLTYDVQFEKDSTIKSLVAKYAKLQLY
jgi:DNA helicase II / ATP-dependent DNA helicase PcrA